MSPADIATIEQALSALAVSEDAAVSATEALGQLRRRDWAVRVLDAYGRGIPGSQGPSAPTLDMKRKPAQRWRVFGSWTKAGVKSCHYGATENAARLAAAQAVYPELPAAVRADLGECP